MPKALRFCVRKKGDNNKSLAPNLHFQLPYSTKDAFSKDAFSWKQIQAAIDRLHQLGCREICLDKIKVCLENKGIDEVISPEKKDFGNKKSINLPSQQSHQIEQLALQQLEQLTQLLHFN